MGDRTLRSSAGPDFRVSLLDAAADYIDEGMPDAAVRALSTILDRLEDGRVPRWIERAESGSEAVELASELRSEVARLREEQWRGLPFDSPLRGSR